MNRVRALLGVVGILMALIAAPAPVRAEAAATPLDHYLDGLKSLETDFTQQVVDAKGTEVEAGSGKLLILRPGKFRWEYTPANAATAGGAQLLVADGRNLWFYDRELMQVTVKPMTAALGATPVALLSGAAGDLRSTFTIEAEPAREGLAWVRVTPRSAESDFQQAELGFKGGELAAMVIADKLGQHATLHFVHSQRNARVAESQFDFKAPPGVDVIGTPQPP
jgi:outer membrane lipoprotein carrier protein